MIAGQIFLGIVMISAGCALIVMAILGKHRRLPRNFFIGFRTETIMHSERTWMAAHRAAWIWTTLAGVSVIFTGIGVMFTNEKVNLFSWATTGLVLLLLCIINAAIVAQKAAKREQRRRYDTRPQ